MAVDARQVQSFTAGKLKRLLASPDDSSTKAALANMRRGIGRAPGDMPGLWGVLFRDMPEEMLSSSKAPSKAEWAAYIALTLFALHQQGRDPSKEPMSREKYTLGRAVRALIPTGDDDAESRIQRRFNAAATSGDMDELAYHLRGVVQLLRAEGIPLDYPALAADIFNYQFQDRAPSVRLAWGQDFYRIREEKTQNETEGKDNSNA